MVVLMLSQRLAWRMLKTGILSKPHFVLAAVVNTTVVAGENLTVGSTVWLPAESLAPGR
jgi:hypothetical protein